MSVSVIVPCYNVEKYISRCLNSINEQTLDDLEIICVNDGTSDNTLSLLNNINNIRNLTIINKTNGGYGSAINLGISLASKEYIAICEGDDEVLPEYYELLYKEASFYNLDVCFVNSYLEIRNGFKDNFITGYTPSFENTTVLTVKQINERLSLGNVGITTCIFKKSYLLENNIKLDEVSRCYEDVGFILNLLIKKGRIGIMPGCGYLYHKDVDTQTVANPAKFKNIINSIKYSLSLLKNENDEYKNAVLGYCLIHLVTYYNKTVEENYFDVANDILNFIKLISKNNIDTKIYLTYSVKNTLEKLGCKNSFRIVSKEKANYNSTPSLGVCFDKSYSFFVSIAQYKFIYLTVNSEEICKNINKILNDLIVYENSKHSRSDKVFKNFCSIFFKTINFYDLNKLSDNLRTRLFMLAYEFGLIDSISFIKPKMIQGGISSFISKCDSWSSLPNFDNYFKFYNNGFKGRENLLKFIKNKSICVVGNSPNILGKGLGKFIDSHDIVIRFNNYPTDYSIIQDLGYKTSIWCLTPALDSIYFKSNCINAEYILCFMSNLNYIDTRVNILNNLVQSGFNLALIPCDKYLWKNNIRVLSLGLLVAEFLQEQASSLGKVSFVGFGLKSQTEGVTHYFKGDPSEGKELNFHKWDLEDTIFSRIVSKFK